jgi:hypothetical protein
LGAVRSLDSACGDQLHHYCDVYPCLWERTFATWEVDPLVGLVTLYFAVKPRIKPLSQTACKKSSYHNG